MQQGCAQGLQQGCVQGVGRRDVYWGVQFGCVQGFAAGVGTGECSGVGTGGCNVGVYRGTATVCKGVCSKGVYRGYSKGGLQAVAERGWVQGVAAGVGARVGAGVGSGGCTGCTRETVAELSLLNWSVVIGNGGPARGPLYRQAGAHLVVVCPPRAHKDAIPHIKGVHHEEVDDGFQQLLQGVAEAEGEGQHQRGAGQPRSVQIHLHTHHHPSHCMN